MKEQHEQDEDCTIDPETNCCIKCGIKHSNPCLSCGGRAYHKNGCPTMKFVDNVFDFIKTLKR